MILEDEHNNFHGWCMEIILTIFFYDSTLPLTKAFLLNNVKFKEAHSCSFQYTCHVLHNIGGSNEFWRSLHSSSPSAHNVVFFPRKPISIWKMCVLSCERHPVATTKKIEKKNLWEKLHFKNLVCSSHTLQIFCQDLHIIELCDTRCWGAASVYNCLSEHLEPHSPSGTLLLRRRGDSSRMRVLAGW